MVKKRKKQHFISTKIEKQELVSEVRTKSYELVRCHIVKYIGNDYSFIDLRYFQKGYKSGNLGNETEEIYPTQKGVQIKEELFDKIITDYLSHLIKQKGKKG